MATALKVKKRDIKAKKAGALRREGIIPATVYGPEIKPIDIEVCQKEFRKLTYADRAKLVELEGVEAENMDVLIKNVQRDHLTEEVLNVEFYKVKKGHKLTTKVHLKFINNSAAVKMGADLVTVHSEVNIRCIPRKIPDNVEVDLSLLAEIGDHITFADLKVDEEIEILEPAKEVVCKVEAKRQAAEEPAVEAVAAAAPEAESNKKD